MALRNPRHLRWRRRAGAVAVLAAACALAAPAGAQWFGDRFPYGQHPSRPQAPQRNFFSFPFFGDQNNSFIRPPQPVESTTAPPPRKLETPPTSTVVVIGDSMADWLAYGLEEAVADTPEIGVVRKIRPTSGLIRYEPRNDTLEWSQAVKDVLAPEKPSAIVVMLGLNDRLPLRDRIAARPGSQRNGEEPAQAAGQPTQPSAPAQGATPPAGAPGAPGAATAAGSAPQEAGARATQRQAQGGSYEFQTDKWAELYTKRIDEMIAALKSKGVPVLWVGLPALRGPRSTSDMGYLDELYRERAEKAGISYVDIWDGFVDENGRYAVQGPDFEGQIRRLRTADGVHFTKAGAVKLASYVERELRRVLSNRLAPVAVPGPEATAPSKPAVGGPRPVVGPVIPLTASTGDATDLLGAGNRPTPVAADPVATQVLSRGDPLTASPGRADDFSWPHPAADANATPDAEPRPAALTPPASAKGPAGRNGAKKSDDAESKAKPAPDAAAVRPRHSPHAERDGAPRPAPPGPAAANTR